MANVEVTNLNIRQLESSSESLQPQASTQTSERDSNLDSDSTSSRLYTGTTSDTGERNTSDNLNNAGERDTSDNLNNAGERDTSDNLNIAGERDTSDNLNIAGERDTSDSLNNASERDTSERDTSERDTSDNLNNAGESGELSEEEDQRPNLPVPIFPIGQPVEGWCKAEQNAPGYSRTRVYKEKAYYHRNKDELKRRREEKKARKAGIPVSKKAKPIYSDIALLFRNSTTMKALPSHLPLGEEIPSVPSNCIAPLLAPVVPEVSTTVQVTTVPLASDFEDSIQSSISFEAEAQDLDIWLKKNQEQVTGDWLLRVECLRDLLKMKFKKEGSLRRKDWVQFSEALARRVNRSTRWAGLLRYWEKQWFEMRTPPPCPRQGRHIERQTLFNDEGV